MNKSELAAECCGVPQVLASQKARVQKVWDGHLCVNMGLQAVLVPAYKFELSKKKSAECPERMCRQCQPVDLVLRGKQLLLELGWKKRVYPFAGWAGGQDTCFWMPSPHTPNSRIRAIRPTRAEITRWV